ncbi:MAG TPA: NAD-dependent epimerase/dehydratase family protein [Anaeromyxobacteraceae bacterium]|nr:NAD-dependent epimerase/dehydratase family protein [Anaeromyxobacteraceae bacterium]
MHALVTGAGGFLGQAVVRALSARGARVRALVRRPEPALALPGVEPMVGDATDPAALAAAVRGVAVVFHLAGVRRAAERDEFFRVNVGSTRLLLDACVERGPGLHRFVLAGSRAAAAPSATGVVESDPLQPAEWYGESKAEAERVAFQYRDRLKIAVARPPRIMGPGDRENLLFFTVARKGWALRFGGDRPLSWIDVDDCARGLLLLAERPEAVGEAFFLASDELTSVEGLMLAAAAALGVTPRRVDVPGPVLSAAAALADLWTRRTGRKLPLNRKLARQLLAPGWVCDASKAKHRLGFEAPTPLADSIGRAARWYVEQGWLS